ncbi:MAG: bile acid:sodium symporter family protein [Pseudomonadota bacterium]
MKKVSALFLTLFPLWVIAAAVAGFAVPDFLSSFSDWVVPLLMCVMLCMGLTLSVDDFIKVSEYKWALCIGVLLQFSVMPAIAFLISLSLGFSPELTAGMVIVGSVAGGTASNVIALIAGGNVALSVSMTAFSTLFSIFMTPLLLLLWVGTTVEVQAGAMLLNLIKIVMIPVAGGVLINHFFSETIQKIELGLPPLAVIIIVYLIAIIVALNADTITEVALPVVIATLAHNVLGLCAGYAAARALRYDSVISRTIAIEVGMQNAGIASVLALKFFTPLAAVPGAVFTIWLNITGSIFAYFCRRMDAKNIGSQQAEDGQAEDGLHVGSSLN